VNWGNRPRLINASSRPCTGTVGRVSGQRRLHANIVAAAPAGNGARCRHGFVGSTALRERRFAFEPHSRQQIFEPFNRVLALVAVFSPQR
jgi:hypothetical protein